MRHETKGESSGIGIEGMILAKVLLYGMYGKYSDLNI